jgi:hypothetical protein
MYATSANQLPVDFGGGRTVTFKMHADVGVDLVRWLRNQVNRIQVANKRADKIEKAAENLAVDATDEQFEKLTTEAEAARNRADEVAMCVEYIRRGSNGWTDFYEDKDAEARGEVLPFDEKNIPRLGLMNLTTVINAFNKHYGLTGDQTPGEAKGESLPALSPSKAEVESLPNGIASSAPIAP